MNETDELVHEITNNKFKHMKMDIPRCYNPFGIEINPYDTCPECNDVYKRCPHLKTNYILLRLKQAIKDKTPFSVQGDSIIIGEFSDEEMKDI